jgi:hypothetical protein
MINTIDPEPQQPTLFDRHPAAIPAELHWLETTLLSAADWMTARDIQTVGGQQFHDRAIRRLANQSANIISGQNGYRHIDTATPEEIRHCANALTSQADQMRLRAIRILRRAHALVG